MNSMGLNTTCVNAVKYASISATADGDNAIVAAVTNKRIRAVAVNFAVNAQGTAQWQDATGNLSGAASLAQYGGFAHSADPSVGLFQGHIGERIDLNMGTGVDGLGEFAYLEV